MGLSNYSFILNLHSTRSQLCLPVTAGDTGRTLQIGFSDGGGLYDLTGIVPKITILEISSGSRFDANEKNISISDTKTHVLYDFEAKTCPQSGLYVLEVNLYREGRRIASPKFSLDAEESLISADDEQNILAGGN